MTGARLGIESEQRERQRKATEEHLRMRKRVSSAGKLGKMFAAKKPHSKPGGLTAVQSDVVLALRSEGYSSAEAKKRVQSASGSDFDSLFRDAIRRNPRQGVKSMATKKRKKKSSRKSKMPAGLKAYWAKKRRAKTKRRPAKRRNPRKKRARAKVRTRTRTIIKYRTRTVRVKAKRRRPRKSNPRRKARRQIRIKAPAGLGPKGLRQFRAMAARAYGMPARIVNR